MKFTLKISLILSKYEKNMETNKVILLELIGISLFN